MFKIGARVFTTDGEAGTLRYVVLDPATREVTDLVVEKGLLLKEDRVVSVADVSHVDEDGIYLILSSEELKQRRRFKHAEFVVPDWEVKAPYKASEVLAWMDPYVGMPNFAQPTVRVHIDEGVSNEAATIGKGTPILTRLGERVGTLDHAVVDPESRQPIYLVLRLPGIRRRRVVVSATQVKEWAHDGVILNLERSDLKALPPYTPARGDAALAVAVREAIEGLALPLQNLGITVNQGHVVLEGHAETAEARRKADQAARAVEGVLSVTNRITTDAGLQTRIQGRLLDDPIASLYPVDVVVHNGAVRVVGKVPNTAIQDIILNIVRLTPGVVSVIDEIEVRPEAFEEPAPVVAVAQQFQQT